MSAVYEFMYMLERAGVADVILPFALVFTVVFAILEKTKILGVDPDTERPMSNLNAMVALVMGFSVIVPHVLRYYPPHMDPVLILNSSLPSVAIILVAIIMVLMMIGLLNGGKEASVGEGMTGNVALVVAILVVAFIFLSNAGFLNFRLYISRGTQSAVLALLIFGIVIWAVMKGSGGGSGED